MGMRKSLIHILLFVATQTWATRLVHRELSDYPLALCNDGTFASYFYSEEDLANPYLLIDLQGGGLCQSPESCQDRCETDKPSLCTTDTTPYQYLNTTMWSQDPEENPPFHNFGKVFVHYCSSDVYSGTRNESADINGYYFHGKYIIEALVEDIIKHKPDIESMEQLVLMGQSAGAYGVVLNCDYVAEQFRDVVKDLDVRCIADAGDFFPVWVHNDGCDPYESINKRNEFWQGLGDQSCFDTSPEGSLECLIFASYYNFIETPYMVVGHYIDIALHHGPCIPPQFQNQEFWDSWEQQMYELALSFIEDKPKNALFLSNCRFHVSVTKQFAWDQMDVPLVNAEGSELYKNVVHNWLTGEGPYLAMDMPLEKNPKCPYY